MVPYVFFVLFNSNHQVALRIDACAGEETIARAYRDICVLAVLLCCIMQLIFDAN